MPPSDHPQSQDSDSTIICTPVSFVHHGGLGIGAEVVGCRETDQHSLVLDSAMAFVYRGMVSWSRYLNKRSVGDCSSGDGDVFGGVERPHTRLAGRDAWVSCLVDPWRTESPGAFLTPLSSVDCLCRCILARPTSTEQFGYARASALDQLIQLGRDSEDQGLTGLTHSQSIKTCSVLAHNPPYRRRSR